ncbi:MAG: GDSL-type esterase/lipase family protein [Verrucomicrobiae bacterium]|nr:GDSL-type esterase/lipase family protein [Verrucomicrobiae bacterium]
MGIIAKFAAITLSCASHALAASEFLSGVQRVVVLGDSITYSGAYVEFLDAYVVTRFPERRMEIFNLGLPSENVSGLSEPGHAGGKFPRPDLRERLGRVLAKTKPDLVIACYGMNDGIYYPFSEERFRKFQDGIRRMRERVTATGASILHITPPTFDPEPIKARTLPAGLPEYRQPYVGYNEVLDRYAAWLLEQRKNGWDVVDVHGPMNRDLAEHRKQDPNFLLAKDGVHANETGHWIMAKQILLHLGAKDVGGADSAAAMLAAHPRGKEILALVQQRQRLLKDAWLANTGHKRPGMKQGLPLAEAQAKSVEIEKQIREMAAGVAAPFPGQKSQWHGYDRYDFTAGGKQVTVSVPKQPLPGKLWAWKGEFLDAFPAAEIALLGRGVHIVYLRVPDLLGCPRAVAHWDACYKELTGKLGFAKKVALIGLSRGGLYCYNWAAANPDKVACIYADAAVCDFKSWPGGKGKGKGSPRDWKLVMDCYGFKTEAEALAYRGNPVDNLAPLAKAKVPLIHVYGDADDVVPWDENTGVVAERYRKLGGSITLIAKPGVGHHPHGLADPAPVVEFILKHCRLANGVTP